MTMLQVIRNFIREGGKVFSQASRGEYVDPSPHIQAIRDSVMRSAECSGAAIDRGNLKRDREKISKDVGNAFEKYKMINGYE